jgi:hypothetical protein
LRLVDTAWTRRVKTVDKFVAVVGARIRLATALVGVAIGLAATPALAKSGPTVHGCPRLIKYSRNGQGGIYNFRHMSCERARHVARRELQGHSVPGFACHAVASTASMPEGAEKCVHRSAYVIFASE